MTSKQKAHELVDKFSVVGLQLRNEGMSCAKICVDEILKELGEIDDGQTYIPYDYWQDVKKEIEKL